MGVRGWPLAGCALLAWVPDLDLLAGLALEGDVHAFHRAWWSHSPAVAVFGAVATFLAYALIATLRLRALALRGMARTALIVGVVLLTHVVLDYVLINPVLWALRSEAGWPLLPVLREVLLWISDVLF